MCWPGQGSFPGLAGGWGCNSGEHKDGLKPFLCPSLSHCWCSAAQLCRILLLCLCWEREKRSSRFHCKWNRTKRGLGRPEITSFFIRTTWAEAGSWHLQVLLHYFSRGMQARLRQRGLMGANCFVGLRSREMVWINTQHVSGSCLRLG